MPSTPVSRQLGAVPISYLARELPSVPATVAGPSTARVGALSLDTERFLPWPPRPHTDHQN